ncbi:uncharacterized protein N7515_008167 [Penicillium bovifimosum]|uniref:Uncharacterized protein n=1 Tax=Penicillium bovifimosum TaxID=126998 RepID=A0A9W9GMT5_9EURO|nr:uncharacterized protein N7515_008167 [Penicillium bovifimosum]KAJ5124342.1 hypothetical protein N7515_008167 [Penicillium bovifimosum]
MFVRIRNPWLPNNHQAKREKKPNLSKIARQCRVSRRTLYNRMKKGVRPRPTRATIDESVPETDQSVETRMIKACERLNARQILTSAKFTSH